MSGLYLHIPFCKQACHYCNFHFSTSLRYKDSMVQAIAKEIKTRRQYLDHSPINSVYFGGGTPSLLEGDDFNLLFDSIHQSFSISPTAEITLEANPDDITEEKLKTWKKHGINRLSIGVQSFSDQDLVYMNRAHNASEAKTCIRMAQSEGFHNITVDLIYGCPTTDDRTWEDNVNSLIQLDIPHLSCYALTVEPKTALAYKVNQQILPPVDEEQSARQFELLMEWMKSHQYIHYETSNFAKEGFLAKHNSAYWQGVPYLGVGPSAHSYNRHSRQWNIANNAKYLKCFDTTDLPTEGQLKTSGLYEVEQLSKDDQYNELILTGLRTIWGVDIEQFSDKQKKHFQQNIHQFIDSKHIFVLKTKYSLTPKGRLITDYISSQLFI